MLNAPARPGEALDRLREYLADGFGFDPAAPARNTDDAATVQALALASIAESLHVLVSGDLP